MLVAQYMVSQFESNLSPWLTGVGFYDHSILNKMVSGLKTYHNSYLEILFGCGLPVFLLFLYFSFLRPIYVFFKIFSNFFPLVPPIVIIPFFESNFTAGQFLFFPWFILTCIAGLKLKTKYNETNHTIL